MYDFIKPEFLPPEEEIPEPERKPYPFPDEHEPEESQFYEPVITEDNNLVDIQQKREQLMQQYYKAAQAGDAQAVKRISEELQNLK